MVVVKTLLRFSISFEILSPSKVNSLTKLKPRSFISCEIGRTLPTSVIVVFSTLHFRPEKVAKSDNIVFKRDKDCNVAKVATVVSSAKALALSVFLSIPLLNVPHNCSQLL